MCKNNYVLKSNLLYIFFLISSLGFSKFSHEENLKLLASATTNEEKVGAYINVIKGFVTTSPDTAIVYIRQLDLLYSSDEIYLSKEVLSKLKFFKGIYQYKKGFYLRAIKIIEESFFLASDESAKGQRFFYLGLSHELLGHYSKATECFVDALKQHDKTRGKYDVLDIYLNLGKLCGKTNKHQKALDYFGKALELAKKTKNETLKRIIYNNMGNASLSLKDYELALSQYNASYLVSLQAEYKTGQFLTLINIANAKRKLKRYNEALVNLKQALRLSDTIGLPTLKGTIFHELGDFFTELKNVNKAKLYLDKSYVIADTLKHHQNLKSIYRSYIYLYKSVGNYKKSLYYYEKYQELKGFLFEKKNELKVTQLYAEFELDKKSQELSALEQKKKIKQQEDKLQKAKLLAQIIKTKRDSLFSYLVIGLGFLLLVIAAGLVFISMLKNRKKGDLEDVNFALKDTQGKVESQNLDLERVNENLDKINEKLRSKNSEVKYQKEELQSQKALLNLTNDQLKNRNKDVTDSIHYAQKIQQAMLNSSFKIDDGEMEHFLFYKPRDIVSGDFYWGHKINDLLIIAVGDCTGHGVPGAFMSCLGISLLNEIIFGRKIIEPHTILENLRNSVIQLIGADRNADLQIGDGMDVSIIVINIETRKMQFSGAMNGVVIISGGVLHELKGDKSPIGQHIIPNHSFTLQEHQLLENDLIYLSTDGFEDQSGGPKGKKMGKLRLNESLTEVSTESFKIQYSKIISLFKSWKKFEKQGDDVCLLGIKVK